MMRVGGREERGQTSKRERSREEEGSETVGDLTFSEKGTTEDPKDS